MELNFECDLCTDSSVTADIHTARFVVKVSIKPHLYKRKEIHGVKTWPTPGPKVLFKHW